MLIKFEIDIQDDIIEDILSEYLEHHIYEHDSEVLESAKVPTKANLIKQLMSNKPSMKLIETILVNDLQANAEHLIEEWIYNDDIVFPLVDKWARICEEIQNEHYQLQSELEAKALLEKSGYEVSKKTSKKR